MPTKGDITRGTQKFNLTIKPNKKNFLYDFHKL